jgi:hypothetical protein
MCFECKEVDEGTCPRTYTFVGGTATQVVQPTIISIFVQELDGSLICTDLPVLPVSPTKST